jgi:hypothetical protein
MGEVFGRTTMKVLAGLVGASLITCTVFAQTQNDPPGRVGRLAFVEGTVSFHDDEENGWTKAVVNTPLTTGDAIWTEPNSRSEVSLAGTRIRMDGSTELDMTQIDDRQVRLQLAQGRVDVKTTTQMDATQPYELVTPRGTITLQQQGDYYVEAGSQQDPTRLGVRAGAAQIQGLNGQTLAVRPGEVGEVYGDGSSMQLKTVRAAPPAPAASWAARDRQVVYDQQPQYLPAGMTGYEDLNGYGNWVNDGNYGQVWVPRSTPADWAPYRTGHWSYVKPWGWTWIDDQPWGFAPYHYGRWANSNNRWVWVPPQREERPVYAPALVAFVGGLELAAQLGNQGRTSAPVGWFPLGPREVYVPPYSTNRDYYQRINRAARIQDRELQERWERAQRREAFVAGQNSVLANQRFATIVPSQTFVRSQPVQRAALKVTADQIAKAAVAPVSAPPAPTASIAAAADAKATAQPADDKPAAGPKGQADAQAKGPDAPVARTAVADMQTLARPKAAEGEKKPVAPGPKIASTDSKAATGDRADGKTAKPATPPLQPRQGAAPPALKETGKAAPEQAKQESEKPGRARQEPGKAAAPSQKEAAPAPPKPTLGTPDPSPSKRDDNKRDEPKQAAPATEKPAEPQSRQEERKQAAPDQQKPNAAPQPKQDEPKLAAPQRAPAAAPPPRQEEPRQAAPQPAPKPEAAPRQEAPRQAAPAPAPQPRAEPQQPPQQAQPQRPQPQPQQQQGPKDRETRAPAPQQQQIAQPPKAEPQQQQQPQRNNNKKDKD